MLSLLVCITYGRIIIQQNTGIIIINDKFISDRARARHQTVTIELTWVHESTYAYILLWRFLEFGFLVRQRFSDQEEEGGGGRRSMKRREKTRMRLMWFNLQLISSIVMSADPLCVVARIAKPRRRADRTHKKRELGSNLHHQGNSSSQGQVLVWLWRYVACHFTLHYYGIF